MQEQHCQNIRGYNNITSYWIASPTFGGDSYSNRYSRSINGAGWGTSGSSDGYGVRPAVCFSSAVTLTEVTEDGWTYYQIGSVQ